MLLISSTSTSTARLCWKKYYFRYIQHLKPITSTIQTQQGRIVHEAFDKFYKGETQQNITQYIIDTYDLELSKAEYVDQEQLEIAKYTALGMWLGYPHSKRLQYTVIGSERDFTVPIARGVRLRGKIDRTLKKQGVWWIGETKLTGEYETAFTRRVETSHQATSYVYAMQQMGYEVQGVAYDVIKKPALRKGRSETCSQFCRRIAYDYKRRPEHYYYTYPTYRSKQHVKLFKEDTVALTKSIKMHMAKGDWYRNPDACYTYNSECPYKKICDQAQPDNLTLSLYYTRGGENYDEERNEEAGRADSSSGINANGSDNGVNSND